MKNGGHSVFRAILLWLCVSGLGGAAESTLLYEKRSDYSTIVVTEDEEGLRTLSFGRGGARQSVVKVGDPDHIELPYVRAMLVSLAVVGDPGRVLVIGLGGGTLPSFLRRHYPEATIDAVDIDPEVIEVAKSHFGFREDARMRAHVRDGRKFIEEVAEPYDLIFLDAFSADSIPRQLTTRQFLEAVRRAMKPGGGVVANLWSQSSNPLYQPMVNTYREVFEQLYLLDVPGAGNVILFGLPWREPLGRDELERRTEELVRRWGFKLDLPWMVRQGFESAGPKRIGGRVLVDERGATP